MMDFLLRFMREEDGPTSVEYAVMIGLIVAICIGSVNLLANQTAASFDNSAGQLGGAFGS